MSERLPRDLRPAVEVFEEFHKFDHADIGEFKKSLTIPQTVENAGRAAVLYYTSDKWGDKNQGYYHDVESRVRVGLTDAGGVRIRVPAKVRSTETLTRIGRCDGFDYTDGEGDVINVKPPGGTEWYWSVRGKALFVIEKKRKLHAILWGGQLNVRPEGIVG